MDLFGTTLSDEDDLEDLDDRGERKAATQPDAILPGQRHPRAATLCLGHEEIEQQLCNYFNTGRMPHALIFSGNEGIGKATMAFRLARFLLTRPPVDSDQNSLLGEDIKAPAAENLNANPDHPALRRILANAHADLLVIERGYDEVKNKRKAAVDVADARRVAPFLRRTAAEGGWRVVIIDDADTMNRNAQNAILKILEEPPERTVIILIAHRAGAMIPTIRSRTRGLHFKPLSPAHIERLLPLYGHRLEYNAARMVTTFAAGSIGKALAFIDEGGMDALTRLLPLLDTMPRMNWTQIHLLSEDLARQDQDTATFATVLSWVFQQITMTRAKNSALAASLDTTAIRALLARKTMTELAGLSEALDMHLQGAEHANLDKRATILEAFAIIEQQTG